MRKVLITESQKHEIEALTAEHFDALVAYGADMYNQGIIKGAGIALVTAGITVLGLGVVREVREHKNTQAQNN